MLIQLRSMMDGGVLTKSVRPQPKASMDGAAERFSAFFEDADQKSCYNVFSQNPWYAGSKLAPIAGGISLKKLIDCQMNLAKAFQDLISRPNSDEQVMRDLFVLCMSK